MNGEARKERTSNISNRKMRLKGLIQHVFFIPSSVMLSGQGYVLKACISLRPILLKILFRTLKMKSIG
jgi:hypothetical protein